MCPSGCAIQEGLAGDTPGGAGWDTQGGTLSDPGHGGGPAGIGHGRRVLVAQEFPPVSALVPFHGSTLSLGYFSSLSF